MFASAFALCLFMNVIYLYVFFFPMLVPHDSVQPILVGCERDDDCPDFAACRNRACVNPCAEDKPCAPNANCRVTRHQAVCTCPDGYIGSPETECKLRKCALILHTYWWESVQKCVCNIN